MSHKYTDFTQDIRLFLLPNAAIGVMVDLQWKLTSTRSDLVETTLELTAMRSFVTSWQRALCVAERKMSTSSLRSCSRLPHAINIQVPCRTLNIFISTAMSTSLEEFVLFNFT
jgi:hypothetical protein